MGADTVVERGPGSTALVFRRGGGTRGFARRQVLRSGGPALLTLLLLVPAAVPVVAALLALGSGTAVALSVAAVMVAAGVAVIWVRHAREALGQIRRVEFAPAEAPTALRFVRAGEPGAWLPIAELERIVLVQWTVRPAPGELRPTAGFFTVRLAMRYGVENPRLVRHRSDARRLARALQALLAVRGVPVELETRQLVRRRSQAGGWVGGGSAMAGPR
ncbi:hypothetical protein [Saccharothrix sp. ST-888]|uniref:hypothetical protein n=1 Tax=Saccharothrix sp. ST-888 TaxID=1427391 RepID=UPI0006968642|nr:hypothetical protein [Saccharothrix sp. ST-888]